MSTSIRGAITAASVLVLAACSSPAASSSPSAVPAPDAELAQALAGGYRGTSVAVLGAWVDEAGSAFDVSLRSFRDATGVKVVYEGLAGYEVALGGRVDTGRAPDIAEIAQPGTMRTFQAEGRLVDLSPILDLERLRREQNPSLLDLASVGGRPYGLYYSQDVESLVWYPVEAFTAAGYAVPATWEALIALSDRIVTDGGTPWCVGIEQQELSGWVATDWLEDILLRTASLATYDAWMSHEIPFDDPAVLHAADLLGQVWFTKDYVYGGTDGIAATWVGDVQTPMFSPGGPKCWLHKQAAWAPDFWPTDAQGAPVYTPGVDSAVFAFPPIDPAFGRPVVGSGEMLVMFNDRPEVRALLQWLSTAEGTAARVAAGGFLAADNALPAAAYPGYPESGLAAIARTATALRYDASDAMPRAVGAGSFLTGMVKWVADGGKGTGAILKAIEDSWPK
jgi:alpha-glucoside transport system substrate-binding protein